MPVRARRPPRPLRRTEHVIVACSLGGIFLAGPTFAQPDCPEPLCHGSAFIYGGAGWYAVGDTIQFVGDSNVDGGPGGGGCAAHKWTWANCHVDNGLTFRQVTDVDLQSCSYTASSTCDLVKAECCAFWGSEDVCPSCSYCCPDCDLCLSFWEVIDFHADGVTGRGCWELEFVADCDASNCLAGTAFCSQRRNWFD